MKYELPCLDGPQHSYNKWKFHCLHSPTKEIFISSQNMFGFIKMLIIAAWILDQIHCYLELFLFNWLEYHYYFIVDRINFINSCLYWDNITNYVRKNSPFYKYFYKKICFYVWLKNIINQFIINMLIK